MSLERFAIFAVLLLATASCRTAGSTRGQQRPTYVENHDPAFTRLLGGYEIAPHDGWVALQDYQTKLVVQVGVEEVEGREIKAEEFSVWALLADGKALTFERKIPNDGEPIMGYGKSGIHVGLIPFWFSWNHRERPVAVVLKLKDQYKTFPVPGKRAVPRIEKSPSKTKQRNTPYHHQSAAQC
jgi:hypothetical protein